VGVSFSAARFVCRTTAAVAFAVSLNSAAQAQSGFPCDSFSKNADGSWSAIHSAAVPGPGTTLHVNEGAVFPPNMSFMGMNLAERLDRECPAVAAAAPVSGAPPQVELSKLADTNGDIDMQKLTCGQLADTYQVDADFLLTWYSGWSNGLAKLHTLNVARVKAAAHDVIIYCKANKDKLITQAIDAIVKSARR
jgi:HdeA/HdeB family